MHGPLNVKYTYIFLKLKNIPAVKSVLRSSLPSFFGIFFLPLHIQPAELDVHATTHVGLHAKRPLFYVLKQKLIMSEKFCKCPTPRYEIS
jgi:hypothetical protein